jgi:hypothetical protein
LLIPAGGSVQSDVRLEAPDADAAEQEQDATLGAGEAEEIEVDKHDVPLEADEADLAEQAREVNVDDDEYR